MSRKRKSTPMAETDIAANAAPVIPPVATQEEINFAESLTKLDVLPLATQIDFAMWLLAEARRNNNWSTVDNALIALAVAAKNA